MSIGRVPEVLFALLLMSALGLLGVWIKTSEVQAHRLWVLESRFLPRGPFPDPIPGTVANRPSLPTRGSLEGRLGRLYPRYAWRWALLRLRLHRIEQMVWIQGDAGRRVPPLALLLWPGLAEAVRRRAVKLTSPIAFPNEIVFHLGLWGAVFGTLGLTVGYVLSPVAVPPHLILLLLAGLLTAGLIAIIANVPGRWRDDH